MARRQDRNISHNIEEAIEAEVAEAEVKEDLTETERSGEVSAEQAGAENQARLARGEEPVVPENVESDTLTDAEKAASRETFGDSVGVDTMALRQSQVRQEDRERAEESV